MKLPYMDHLGHGSLGKFLIFVWGGNFSKPEGWFIRFLECICQFVWKRVTFTSVFSMIKGVSNLTFIYVSMGLNHHL